MKDLKLVERNTRLLLRRSRAFGLFAAAGVAFVVAIGWLVDQAGAAAEEEILESTIMRTVEVSSVGHGRVVPITHERIREVSARPEVVSVEPWIQAGFLVLESEVTVQGVLWATPRMSCGQPSVVAAIREPLLPLTSEEVILPDRIRGQDLTVLLGDEIDIEYTVRTGENTGEPAYTRLTVAGLYDAATAGRDGSAAAYVDRSTALELAAEFEGVSVDALGSQVPYPKMIIEVEQADQVLPLQRELMDEGYQATSIRSQLETLPQAVQLLAGLGKILIAGLVVVSVGAGLSIGAGIVRARWHEIGLLKALGYSDGRVARLVGLELGAFGLIAGVVGAAVGVAAGLAASLMLRGDVILGVSMADRLVVPDTWWHSVLVAASPGVAMLLGGVAPMVKAAMLPPDTALREAA